MRFFIYYLLGINAITFILYGLDKLKAKRKKWRTPESTLILFACIGGSIGACLGMKVWHHKTLHKKFAYGIPFIIFMQAAALTALLILSSCSGSADSKSRHTEKASANSLQEKIDSLLREKPVDVGVAVTRNGEYLCQINADKTFPMMSVFKLHQAIAVLDYIHKDSTWALGTKIDITKDMLHENTYSPLKNEHPDGNIRISIEDLLHYTLHMSDNNACDILFDYFGGCTYADSLVKSLGLEHTQIRWNEDAMHQDIMRSYENYTTPNDAIRILEVAIKDTWLKHCLTQCRTGAERLPAPLPEGLVRIGHKTGTGDTVDGHILGVNDIGFVILPDSTPYFIAVFCSNSFLSMTETEKLIADISELTYEHITNSTKQNEHDTTRSH